MQLPTYIEVLESLHLRVIAFEKTRPLFNASASESRDLVVRANSGKLGSGPTKPLWRKREVVRQERTVQYTTVDADGELQVCSLVFFFYRFSTDLIHLLLGLFQELCEKEISETEIVHMECRETGEFAHRETTNYEQTETFNNEVLTLIRRLLLLLLMLAFLLIFLDCC